MNLKGHSFHVYNWWNCHWMMIYSFTTDQKRTFIELLRDYGRRENLIIGVIIVWYRIILIEPGTKSDFCAWKTSNSYKTWLFKFIDMEQRFSDHFIVSSQVVPFQHNVLQICSTFFKREHAYLNKYSFLYRFLKELGNCTFANVNIYI